MGINNDLPAGSFAANLGLRSMFLATFASVCGRAFCDLQTPIESYADPDDFRTDLAQALEATMDELSLEGSPGYREYDWVDGAFPVLALAMEKFCSDPPASQPRITVEAALGEGALRNVGSLLRFYFAALRGMRDGSDKRLDAASFGRLIADVRAGAEAHGVEFGDALALAEGWSAVQDTAAVLADQAASLASLDADTRPPAACNVVGDLESITIQLREADLWPAADKLGEVSAVVVDLIEQQKRDAQLVPVLLVHIKDGLTQRDQDRLETDLATRGLADHDAKRRDVLARSGA